MNRGIKEGLMKRGPLVIVISLPRIFFTNLPLNYFNKQFITFVQQSCALARAL